MRERAEEKKRDFNFLRMREKEIEIGDREIVGEIVKVRDLRIYNNICSFFL